MNEPKINDKTIQGINLLRGLFALLVVVAHAFDLATRSFHPEFLDSATGRVLSLVIGNGFYWVMGFFVLSGFCIQLSVQRSYTRDQYSVRNYLLARVTRIMPLFYIALTVALVVEILLFQSPIRPDVWKSGVDVQTFIGNVLFTQSITGWYGSFAPAWSLTCEMAYYLMWPVALAVFRYDPGRAAIGASVISMVLAIALYLYDTRDPAVNISGIWMLLYMSVLWYAGAFLAHVWTSVQSNRAFVAASSIWIPLLVAVYVLEVSGAINLHISNILLGPVFVLMLVNITTWPDWLFSMPGWCARLGHLSYPLYLLHGPMMMLFGALLVYSGYQSGWIAAFVLLVMSSFFVAYFLGVPLEVRMLEKRKGFLKRVSVNRRHPLIE